MSDPVEAAYNTLMAPYERGLGDLEDAGYVAVRTMEMWIGLKRQTRSALNGRTPLGQTDLTENIVA